jgi:uncharacterized protein
LGGLLPSDRRLVCATGSIGGTFYTAGLELAQALQAGSTCLMRPVPSAGGLDNIARLTKNCADIVFTQAHVAEAAYHGLPPFGKPHRDLRVIARTHSLDLWIVSSAAAGITSLEDIRGRRIAMGTRGGETSRISAGILAAYGHDGSTYEQRYLSISKASEALSTGEIDLLFYLTGGMGSALTELAETHALRVLSVANPILEDLCRRESSWQIATIDTGVEPEPTTTVRVETLLVTRSRLSAGVGQGVWAALHHAARESDILRPALPDESCSLPVHTGVPHD